MKNKGRIMELVLVIFLVGCRSHPSLSETPTLMAGTKIQTASPTNKKQSHSTPTIFVTAPETFAPTQTSEDTISPELNNLPLQTTAESTSIGQPYPFPLTTPNTQPYPIPLETTGGEPYPLPITGTTPQPYPQAQESNSSPTTMPTQGVSTKAAPMITATVTQTAVSPIYEKVAGVVHAAVSGDSLTQVDVTLHATDPTTVELAAGRNQLIEFFAYWCPTCKSLAPLLNYLEKKYENQVRFVYLDIDDPRTIYFKQALGFQYQPQIFLLDGNGKIIQQWIGVVTQEELENSLNALNK
ncbi:MAG: thioredoxin domain-containing protein [Anaerolineales bacterium]